MLRERVQKWKCSLRALGRKVAGKEKGHQTGPGSRYPGRVQGYCERGQGKMTFQTAGRQAGWIRLSLVKESGP